MSDTPGLLIFEGAGAFRRRGVAIVRFLNILIELGLHTVTLFQDVLPQISKNHCTISSSISSDLRFLFDSLGVMVSLMQEIATTEVCIHGG